MSEVPYQLDHILLLAPNRVAHVIFDGRVLKVGDEVNDAFCGSKDGISSSVKIGHLPFSTL